MYSISYKNYPFQSCHKKTFSKLYITCLKRMIFSSPLISGVLVHRYKRFLADIILDCGRELIASVPNTGSMLGLTEPGMKVWLSRSNPITCKYFFKLEIVEAKDILVGVNTSLANFIAEEAILSGLLPSLFGYVTILREQRYHQNSRIDFLLRKEGSCDVFVEVKNVHYVRFPGLAEFPDSITVRGAKHLNALIDVVKNGHRGIMLFIIQRSDCDQFKICRDIDPFYGQQFTVALQHGVEAYALRCDVTRQSITATTLISIMDQ